jgi:hypothetical protein
MRRLLVFLFMTLSASAFCAAPDLEPSREGAERRPEAGSEAQPSTPQGPQTAHGSRPVPPGENLKFEIPLGFKEGFRARQGIMEVIELVPEGESVEDWTEMITVQVFLGVRNVTPQQVHANFRTTGQAACKGLQSQRIEDGEQGGYAFSIWAYDCPVAPVTGKPELALIKIIQGSDSLYSVHKQFRFVPTPERINLWLKFLGEVTVCDTRFPDRPCSIR